LGRDIFIIRLMAAFQWASLDLFLFLYGRKIIMEIKEEEVVELLAERNPKALEWIYDHYASILYGLAFRISGSEHAAADVLKNIFVSLKENPPVTENLLFSLIMQCRELALNHAASNKEGKALFVFPTTGDANDNKLPSLESDYRMVLDLLFCEGLSPQETSQRLNIPLGTVKARLRAALHSLRTSKRKAGM